TEGSVVSLDANTLSLQDSVSINYGVSFLCYVPVKENLYLGISSTANGDRIIVLDLPGLNIINEITVPECLMDMVSDPSGDYVYCSIDYSVDL
ncbi:MAG: hypothetical protein K8S24_12355, partial [Candidatus Aegiribacteria sp.]|nr:hypothetical protein [Candidatus Aegiribacteria sp.]